MNKPLEPLQHISPLVNDMLKLKDRICSDLSSPMPGVALKRTEFFKSMVKGKDGKRKKQLLTDESKKGLDLQPGFEVLLIGTFRSNVWIGFDSEDNPSYVGWIRDPIKLWEEEKINLLGKLRNIFDYAGKGSGLNFLRNPLASEVEVINWGQVKELPTPEILYSVSPCKKFVKDKTKYTHVWTGNELVEDSKATGPDEYLYREVHG